jgi:hypothetical protein
MTSRSLLQPTAALALAIGAVLATPSANAAEAQPGDGYDGYMFALYGWLPGISADLRYQLPSGTADTKSKGSIFDYLSGALMMQATGHYGEWGWYGDFDWVDFSGEKGRFRQIGGANIGGNVTLDTKWSFSGGMFTFAGSYNLYHSNEGFGDLLFGMRYLWTSSDLSWDFGANGNGGLNIANSGKVSRSENLWDAIVGLRGRWRFGDQGRWFVPYYIDGGFGNSNWTSEVGFGIGYAWDWGDVDLSYRDTRYHQSSDTDLIRRVGLSGPAIKFAWYF